MSSIQPDVVVGIDFGMTFTGVAYSRMHMNSPFVIQEWPPRFFEVNRKVPSVISYSAVGDVQFGFPCQFTDGKHEWFKRYLDPSHLEELRNLEPNSDLPRTDEVRRWYRDYMRCLYEYVSRFLQDRISDLNNLAVEWIFSLPTTFRSQEISNTLLGLLKEAGFGRRTNHTVNFGLSEPQASAVDAAKHSANTYKGGDVIFVCDAGGATTDFALLEQTTTGGSRTELREIASIPGIDIGSTNIDTDFELMVDDRLSAGGLRLPDNTSWTMMHSQEFQNWKCQFGHDLSSHVPRFPVRVPLLDESVSNEAANIERGKMLFTHGEFKQLFEPQVAEIIRVIREQLDRMIQSHPGKFVNYIILSGGLGSSPYLLKRLRNEFVTGSHPAAPSLKIILSDQPQLAVCRGLVIDRVQKVMTRRNVLVGLICPASYGVLCDMPYDTKKHVNQPTYKDPVNGLLYVKNQVKWMIRKGQSVDIDSHIAHNFTKIIGKLKDEGSSSGGSNKNIWRNQILISFLDSNQLPSNASHADCHVLADVTSNLSSVPMSEFEVIKEHKPFFKRLGSRDKYRIAEHEIRIVVGSTDIKFELWFQGKQYHGTNSIRVDWLEGASISAPNENNRRVNSNILDGIRKRKAIKSQRNKNTTAQGFRDNLRSPRLGGGSRRFERGQW